MTEFGVSRALYRGGLFLLVMFITALILHELIWVLMQLFVAGIIAAVLIAQRRISARGGQSGQVIDIILWAVPLGIVGARFYHVFTHGGDYFFPGANLWDVFAIWDGGNAIYGGLLGGTVGAFVGCLSPDGGSDPGDESGGVCASARRPARGRRPLDPAGADRRETHPVRGQGAHATEQARER